MYGETWGDLGGATDLAEEPFEVAPHQQPWQPSLRPRVCPRAVDEATGSVGDGDEEGSVRPATRSVKDAEREGGCPGKGLDEGGHSASPLGAETELAIVILAPSIDHAVVTANGTRQAIKAGHRRGVGGMGLVAWGRRGRRQHGVGESTRAEHSLQRVRAGHTAQASAAPPIEASKLQARAAS